jgi:hypothetical protein
MRSHKTMQLALLALAMGGVSGSALAEERICNGTIGPRQLDNIRVPDNGVCTLNGTRANGSLVVGRGASLQANDVRINGNVQAEGALQVTMGAGSQVGGSVQIKQGGGASITGTRIQGDLQFDENVLPLAASDNSIGGNLQVVKNFGGVALYRNVIDSALQCKENSPAPVGGGNSASSKEDQCAAL